MAQVATRVDAGDLDPRMEIAGDRRDEVRVLADAFNRMLDRLSEAFGSQREFVADASHELRTPLTIIRGQLEVLAAQENPSGAEVNRVEQLVLAEITRVSRLVDDLLVLAQAERTDFLRAEAIDVRPFVTEIWDGMSLTADRRFELGRIADGSLYADPDRLAQALRNLARNAIEHTHEHDGLVRLDVTRLAPDRIRFAVLDDGPGIPEDERERVFERFHRTDSGRARSAPGVPVSGSRSCGRSPRLTRAPCASPSRTTGTARQSSWCSPGSIRPETSDGLVGPPLGSYASGQWAPSSSCCCLPSRSASSRYVS